MNHPCLYKVLLRWDILVLFFSTYLRAGSLPKKVTNTIKDMAKIIRITFFKASILTDRSCTLCLSWPNGEIYLVTENHFSYIWFEIYCRKTKPADACEPVSRKKERKRGRKRRRAKLVYCCALNNWNEESSDGEELWLRQLSPPAEADVIPSLGFVFTILFLYPEISFYSPRPPIAAGKQLGIWNRDHVIPRPSPRVFISCKLGEWVWLYEWTKWPRKKGKRAWVLFMAETGTRFTPAKRY